MPIEYSFHTIPFAGQNVLSANMYADWPHKINNQINRQRQSLPDAGCQRSTFDSHRREWAIAKNQNGVEDNVCDAPTHQAYHGCFHVSYCLEYFLECYTNNDNQCKSERNNTIADAKFNHCLRMK